MKKLIIASIMILATTTANAEFMFGIDFDRSINNQFAGDPYTTWTKGGIKIAEPERGIKYIEISVAGFDSNGDTFATGEFTMYSNDMPDEANCHKVSLMIKKQIPQGTRLSSYYGKDDFGCEKGYDGQWNFIYGGDITPQ
jgi:hypothetical protein